MNASNPRTALTTSASRLLALLTGEQKAAGCAPGQAVLGCCLYLGVSLTRKGAAFLHALQTLAAAKGVDLSFSLVYQGREEPLAELSPQHQYLLLHISQRAAVPPRVQVCCHPAGG